MSSFLSLLEVLDAVPFQFVKSLQNVSNFGKKVAIFNRNHKSSDTEDTFDCLDIGRN